VLLLYTCYITSSLITQEKEVTPEETDAMKEIYFNAIDVVNTVGPLLVAETRGDIPITTTAAAILLAGFCIQANVSMHDAVDLLMSAYKQALEFEKDKE
jgi:hypothetical protein